MVRAVTVRITQLYYEEMKKLESKYGSINAVGIRAISLFLQEHARFGHLSEKYKRILLPETRKLR